MPSPSATPTPITPPRVPLIDPRTNLIDRAWYMFFLSLLNAASAVYDNVDLGPSAESLIASYDAALQALAQNVDTQPLPVDLSAELAKQVEAAGLQDQSSALVSQIAEMQKQIEALNLRPAATQGTVTAVTGTAPVVSSGGTEPAISLAAAYGDTLNPYASKTANYVLAAPNGSAGVPTFRLLVAADIPALPYGTGTVTSVAALTLGTTGTDLTSTVANSTTTPVITLNVPTASATNRGALSAADWTTFNNKGSGSVTSVSVVSANGLVGTVATATTTPAITLSTTVTGLLKGNGTAISAAVANTDYQGVAAPVTKTADFTVANGDIWYINNKSGSACTVTLPAASSWSGRTLSFKNMQAQLLNSASSNVVPIDSTTAGTAILLNVIGNWATMVSDGTNWVIMQAASNNNLLLE